MSTSNETETGGHIFEALVALQDGRASMDPVTRKAAEEVLDYNWKDESRHFSEELQDEADSDEEAVRIARTRWKARASTKRGGQ